MEDQVSNTTDDFVDFVTCNSSEHLIGESGYGIYERLIQIGGAASTCMSLLFCAAILLSQLKSSKYYRRLLFLFLAGSLRRGVPLLISCMKIKCINECIINDPDTCKFFSFCDNFMAMIEIETLTHICIERFIDAWYTHKGWSVPRWHHKLFMVITIGLATFYAFLPVAGVGNYGKDLMCYHCSIDTALPKDPTGQKIALTLFFLRNYKPLICIILAWGMTCYLHKYKISNVESYNISNSVFLLAGTYVVMWLPLTITKTAILIYQYQSKDINMSVAAQYFYFGMCTHSLLPLATMLAYTHSDPEISKVLVLVYFWRYDPPDSEEHPKEE